MLAILAGMVVGWFGIYQLMHEAHVRDYAGYCGPHAPDIPKHECTFEKYEAEFDAGFAGVGLFFVQAAAAAVIGAVGGAGWTIAWLIRRRSQKSS